MTQVEHFLNQHWKGVSIIGLAGTLPALLDLYSGIIGAIGVTLSTVLVCISIYAKLKEIKNK